MESAGDHFIIDTDVLVDLLRGLEKTVTFIAELENKGSRLSTTVINVFELYYGAYKSKKRVQNLAATRKLLRRMVILKMNLKSAEKAGQIRAELESGGHPIGIRDIMISAIALTRGYTLVTRNIAHLQKIKGLNLIAAP
ncbi:MAG: type II toxin-antitoxin system VapC family toxin [Thermoproteota archaeon]